MVPPQKQNYYSSRLFVQTRHSMFNISKSPLFLIILLLLSFVATPSWAEQAPINNILTTFNQQLYKDWRFENFIDDFNQQKHHFIKTSQQKNKNELVFVLAGQSNMAGYGTTANLPQAYRRTPSNVKFYFNGYPAKMSRFARFGPEVSFAHAMSRQYPHKTIKLIKFAVGGTSLFAWAPNWNLNKARITRNASAGPLFKKLIQTIRTHTDKEGSQLSGILWMQGETDAKYPVAAHSYSQNLSHFVQALRRELQSPHLAFFMGQVDPPLKIFPYREIVRKAQKNSSRSIRNSQLISTDGLKKRNDHLHYDTDGQLTLGMRFARAYINANRYRH